MVTIPLTRGLTAIVDDADGELVLKYRWYAYPKRKATHYAVASIGGKNVYMHRLLMVPGPGLHVDHINGDGLCNLRSNLRVVEPGRNQANMLPNRNTSSRFKGVTWHSQRGKWVAQIQANKEHRYIGIFRSEVDAAWAYDLEALDAFGEFARPNFVESVRLYREIRRLPHPGNVCFGSIKDA